jgi:MFS family permease
MILVDQTAVPLATPELIQDLGGSISQSPWILTANVLPLAALMVAGGRLGDRYGRRRLFVLGVTAFALASAAAGLHLISPSALPAVVIGATVGSMLESALGATLEPAGVVNNDVLNFINTGVAAFSAVMLAGVLS